MDDLTGDLGAGVTVAAGVGVTVTTGVADGAGAGASCVNLIFTVGLENIKFDADICNHPVALSSETIVVATLASPLSLAIETVAFIGALLKPYRQRATSERS